MNMELTDKLIELRKANNLSQETLAEKLGISRQTISEWECGEISPNTEQMAMLAKIYQIPVDDLLNADGESVHAEEHSFVQEHQQDMLLGLITLAAYLALGFLCRLWHPGWLVFLLEPVVSSAITAIRTKRADRFSYPALVLFIFLYAGCVKMLWHPAWLLFFTMPVYYKITGLLQRNSKD